MVHTFAFLCLLLSVFVRADFDGQVTSVLETISFPDDGLFQASEAGPTSFNQGPFDISPMAGDETHFQYVADFHNVLGSVPPGLGANNNPQYGALQIGPMWGSEGYNFYLTNTQVYAVVFGGGNLWAIPVKKRAYTDVNTYTIIFRRDVGKVSFRIDNIEVAEVPGFCGIDPKFLVFGTPLTSCLPGFIDPAQMVSLFYLGTLSFPVETGFCQASQYNMCLDNVSSASHCLCQKEIATVTGTIAMDAHVYSFEAFIVSRTNRCDGDSSSSEPHNWWQRPIKANEETLVAEIEA